MPCAFPPVLLQIKVVGFKPSKVVVLLSLLSNTMLIKIPD
jgi:hypothetical protein